MSVGQSESMLLNQLHRLEKDDLTRITSGLNSLSLVGTDFIVGYLTFGRTP